MKMEPKGRMPVRGTRKMGLPYQAEEGTGRGMELTRHGKLLLKKEEQIEGKGKKEEEKNV